MTAARDRAVQPGVTAPVVRRTPVGAVPAAPVPLSAHAVPPDARLRADTVRRMGVAFSSGRSAPDVPAPSTSATLRFATSGKVLSMTGTLRSGEGAEQPIAGSVSLGRYQVEYGDTVTDPPGWLNGRARPDDGKQLALRVQNIDVRPRRAGLGDFLLQEAARRARREDAPYVLAIDVAREARSWYERNSFRDYHRQRPHATILDEYMRHDADYRNATSDDEAELAFEARTERGLELAGPGAIMIARTADVLQETGATIAGRWRRGGGKRWVEIPQE